MFGRRAAALGAAASLLLAGSAAAAGPHDGDWAGVLQAGPQSLRLVLHVTTEKGETSAVLDSLDQDTSIPSSAYKADGEKVSVLFLAVGGELEGQFAPDNKTFTGVWTQGAKLPLTLTRIEATPKP